MNNEDLNKIVEARLEAVRDTLIKKGIEYSTNQDRLSNFKLGAKKTGLNPLEVLNGYLLKHLVSFDDICQKYVETGKVNNELLSEKITDILNYYLLAECIMKENQTK